MEVWIDQSEKSNCIRSMIVPDTIGASATALKIPPGPPHLDVLIPSTHTSKTFLPRTTVLLEQSCTMIYLGNSHICLGFHEVALRAHQKALRIAS